MIEGERQVAPDLSGIRRDHRARYDFVARELPKGSRVVDLACGVGYGAYVLAEAGHFVTAIDRDAEAIEYAQRHYAHPRIEFRQADADAIDLPEFDAAVCFETIEHIADPRPMLRALKVAKILYASVPNETVFPWAGYDFHFRHYTRSEFKALLSECGWWVSSWHGQIGDESDVQPDIEGRTIVVTAEVTAEQTTKNVLDDAAKDVGVWLTNKANLMKIRTYKELRVPRHVAILGLGPSVDQYLDFAKKLGGRSKFCDEVWTINALGDVLACDRIFHMDDVRIQEIRAKAKPESNIAAMLTWLKCHPGPIYTSRTHPDYPGLVEFPLEAVMNSTGYLYYNSTAAYAIAYAIHLGVERLSLFGMDFTYPNSHDAEKGRACVEFWLGMAAARKIEINIARYSTLMDACVPFRERAYGYDTLDLHFAKDAEGLKRIRFTERPGLPTADEIEHKYCHDRHPNVLVEAADERAA